MKLGTTGPHWPLPDTLLVHSPLDLKRKEAGDLSLLKLTEIVDRAWTKFCRRGKVVLPPIQDQEMFVGVHAWCFAHEFG